MDELDRKKEELRQAKEELNKLKSQIAMAMATVAAGISGAVMDVLVQRNVLSDAERRNLIDVLLLDLERRQETFPDREVVEIARSMLLRILHPTDGSDNKTSGPPSGR